MSCQPWRSQPSGAVMASVRHGATKGSVASGGLASWVMQSPPADRVSGSFYKASTLAAQMKSFSDKPPIECVENVIRQ